MLKACLSDVLSGDSSGFHWKCFAVATGNSDDAPLFPILRGESVGENGDFNGIVYIVCTPEDLDRDWASNEIAVLDTSLEDFLRANPEVLDRLFEKVSAVITEFGEPIGDLSTSAFEREAICIVKVRDAHHVLENGMHVRVNASENQGDVFFID